MNGSFKNGIIPNASITIGGYIESYITIDWDGDDPNDTWIPPAYVFVAHSVPHDPNSPPATYTGNTPEAHVWETRLARGDVDNNSADGTLWPDFTDINPFVLALSSPLVFEQTYPGLALVDPNAPGGPTYVAGPILYTGDCNCDGSVNMADINPFVALLTNHQLDPNCPPYPGGDAGGGDGPMGGDDPLSPEELAAQLAEHIWPELYGNLLFVVAGAIDAAPDEETQAYWEAVYAVLTQ